jgi:hypothetical protein
MHHEFCTRLPAKIRRLGYAPHEAERLTGFLVSSMTLVCAVTEVLNVPGRALWELTRVMDNPAGEPFDVTVLPAAYSIHRQLPA